MKISISKTIKSLIVMGILLTPILCIGDISGLFLGTITNQSTTLTPLYIKALKDLVFWLIIIFSLVHILKSKTAHKSIFFYFFSLGGVLVLFLLSMNNNALIAFAGLRWILPLFLSFLLIPYIDEDLLKKIARFMPLLFAIHFILQIIQLFFMSKWYGLNSFGLAGRTPGMFFIPGTAGFFNILVLFFVYFYIYKKSIRRIMFPLLFVSSYLTMSGTAMIVYIAFVFLVIGKRKWRNLKLLIGLPILALSSFFTLEILTNRIGILEESFGIRLKIFSDLLTETPFFTSNFGAGTSTGFLLFSQVSTRRTELITGDSTYASIISNLGLFGFIIFCFVFLLWLVFAIKINDLNLWAFTIIYSLYAATNSVLEAFPMNLLFAVLLAYHIGHNIKPVFRTQRVKFN